MGAGKVGIVVGKLTVLIAARNASGSQQGLSSCQQPAVAASDTPILSPAAIAGRHGFPSCALAERAIFRGSLDHLEPFLHRTHSSLSTLHPKTGSAQAGKPVCLCTSCEPRLCPVEDVGKHLQRDWEARVAPIRP